MHTQRPVFSSLLLATLLQLGLTSGALAGNDNRPPPREPPAEAFAACKDKQAGDTCQVVIHDATIAGQCAAIPDGRLACRPGPTHLNRQQSRSDSGVADMMENWIGHQCRGHLVGHESQNRS